MMDGPAKPVGGGAKYVGEPTKCVGVIIPAGLRRDLDEEALTDELEKGRLFAFLDVSNPEPAAAGSPLRRLSNVVYNSHLAGCRDWKIGRQVVDDIEAYLNGGSPLHPVTADMLERIA